MNLRKIIDTILTRHRAVDFEMKNGKISAVVAKDSGGLVRVSCKAVILSTGSWISNRELLRQYAPDFAKIPLRRDAHTSVGYTGDGIELGEKAGAYVDKSTLVLRLMGPMRAMAPGALGAFAASPAALFRDGKRWINEGTTVREDNAFGIAQQLVKQPMGINYVFFDRGWADIYARRQGKNPIFCNADQFGPKVIPDGWEEQLALLEEPDGLQRVMEMDRKNGNGMPPMPPMGNKNTSSAGSDDMPPMPPMGMGEKRIFIADTLEELCKQTGIDYEGLKNTVREYNQMCADEMDKGLCQ